MNDEMTYDERMTVDECGWMRAGAGYFEFKINRNQDGSNDKE